MDQGGQERPEVDAAIVPPVPGQPGAAPVVRPGYNLGNFLRQLALPWPVRTWTLTTLREKLIKIGAKVVCHAKAVTFQLAEVAVPRSLFAAILGRIVRSNSGRNAPRFVASRFGIDHHREGGGDKVILRRQLLFQGFNQETRNGLGSGRPTPGARPGRSACGARPPGGGSEAHQPFWPVGWWASLRSTPPYMGIKIQLRRLDPASE